MIRFCNFILIIIGVALLSPLQAQRENEEHLEGVQNLVQTTYEYTSDTERKRTMQKESVFDTSGILILQDRYQYLQSDTGEVLSSRYHFEYNPATYQGSSYIERFVTVRNKTYSKSVTKFKSFDHFEKRLSVQQYNGEGKLTQQTEYAYDADGHLIQTVLHDYNYTPTLVQTDEITRNSAGKMTRWVSYDDDGNRKQQVRDFKWVYLNDTLVQEASGYVFNDWNQTKNSYSKGVLTKSVQSVGTRNDKGKTKAINITTTNYTNGKPSLTTEIADGKKARTITYRHEPHYLEENIETPEGKTTHITKEIYQNELLLERSWKVDDKVTKSQTHQYNALGGLIRMLETETKINGDEWKTEFLFNERGNLIRRLFMIKKHPKQEDIFEYTYF